VRRSEPTVEDAIALAARLHRGARYPSPESEPYIFHLVRVMLQLADPLDQIVAVLHDAVEDTDLRLDDLREAGYPVEVIAGLDAVTHRGDESYEDYIERLYRNPVARRVKVADLKDNLANNRRSPCAPGNSDRIRRYEAALTRLAAS
jgi:(p)ppGpp synthase/HD superfamily hydrolase